MKNAFKIAAVALTITAFAACKGKGSAGGDSVKTDSVKDRINALKSKLGKA